MRSKADKIQSWMLTIFKDSVPHPFTKGRHVFSLAEAFLSFMFLLTVVFNKMFTPMRMTVKSGSLQIFYEFITLTKFDKSWDDKFGGTSDSELGDRSSLMSVLRIKMGVRVTSAQRHWCRRPCAHAFTGKPTNESEAEKDDHIWAWGVPFRRFLFWL